MAPEITQHIGGVAIAAQDEVTRRSVVEALQCRQLIETAELQHVIADDASKAIVQAAIERLRSFLPTQDGLAIQPGGEAKPVRVVVMVALKPGAIVLAPLPQGASRIASRTTRPWSWQVTVREGCARQVTLYILFAALSPSAYPRTLTHHSNLASAPSDAGEAGAEPEVVSKHDQKPDNFPWPSPLVRRCDGESHSNFEISHGVVRNVSTMVVGDHTHIGASAVEVPIVSNFKAIAKREDVVARWEVAKPEVVAEDKVTAWFDGSQKLAIRRKA